MTKRCLTGKRRSVPYEGFPLLENGIRWMQVGARHEITAGQTRSRSNAAEYVRTTRAYINPLARLFCYRKDLGIYVCNLSLGSNIPS